MIHSGRLLDWVAAPQMKIEVINAGGKKFVGALGAENGVSAEESDKMISRCSAFSIGLSNSNQIELL